MVKKGVFDFEKPISIQSFSFDVKNSEIKGDSLLLSIGIHPRYRITSDKTYEIFLEIGIDAKNEENVVFFDILAKMTTIVKFEEDHSENHKFLINAIAIMYSYLRPIVVQMTVMAKLPPLELEPLNFREIEMKEISSD